MTDKKQIYEHGLEEYPISAIILGNLLMILWIALGTIASWFLIPLLAWVYLAFALIMVYVVLRKLVCPNCYYHGKRCCMGWGRLSALLFKKGEIEDFPESIGIKAAPLTYGLLTIIPLVSIVISIIDEFRVTALVVLLLLLMVSFYSGAINRKKTCAACKMKLICPGSSVNERMENPMEKPGQEL